MEEKQTLSLGFENFLNRRASLAKSELISFQFHISRAEEQISPLLKDDLGAVHLGRVEVKEGPGFFSRKNQDLAKEKLQSPGFSLSIQLACISHHPNFNLPLLLYSHHVCFDQQLVNRTICCQWVIRYLEEERTWIWKSSLKTTSTPTQKSVLLATISSLSYPKMCHQSKDFSSHTRVCDEAKVNINLVHLHMGGQISS